MNKSRWGLLLAAWAVLGVCWAAGGKDHGGKGPIKKAGPEARF